MVVRKLVTVHVALNVKMDVAKRVPVAEDVLHLAMEIVVQIVRTLALQGEWIAITLVQIHVKLDVTHHVMQIAIHHVVDLELQRQRMVEEKLVMYLLKGEYLFM